MSVVRKANTGSAIQSSFRQVAVVEGLGLDQSPIHRRVPAVEAVLGRLVRRRRALATLFQ